MKNRSLKLIPYARSTKHWTLSLCW